MEQQPRRITRDGGLLVPGNPEPAVLLLAPPRHGDAYPVFPGHRYLPGEIWRNAAAYETGSAASSTNTWRSHEVTRVLGTTGFVR
jgi:hypothetical protein